MLPRCAPVPGTGWGCLVCGLAADGAVYVACDRCVQTNARAREVVHGFASAKARVAIESLSAEPFEHRPDFHHSDVRGLVSYPRDDVDDPGFDFDDDEEED
jgi:hypothetical protein